MGKGLPRGSQRHGELVTEVRANFQCSPLCAQAPGTTSRTWTASSPRYPLCSAWQPWHGRAPWAGTAVLGREAVRAQQVSVCWGTSGSVLREGPCTLFLDAPLHLQLPPEERLCLHLPGGRLPARVRCWPQTPGSVLLLLQSCLLLLVYPGPPQAAQGLGGVGRTLGLSWRLGRGLSALKPHHHIPCPPRQFVFIITFTTFLLRCVDYNVLFANQPNNGTRRGLLHSKVTLSDVILPSSQCTQR